MRTNSFNHAGELRRTCARICAAMGVSGGAIVLGGALASCDGVDAANALTGSKDTAEYMKARMQLKAFADAVTAQELSSGQWPLSLDEMAVEGLIKPSDLKDPWGNEYIYAPPSGGDSPILYSMGEDEKANTADDVIHEW